MKRRGIISRRRFLAGAALATALPACRTQPQSTRLSTGSAVHVGVIGCGRRGTELIADLMRRPGAHVVAVCDVFQPHKRRAHALSHARAHHHWEELIVASDVDAVVIATPDHWHGPMALAAMDAGKDVYCEPPLTQRVDQAVAVRNRAAATGRIVQVGARRTFERKWITARELIASGEIGEVTWLPGRLPASTDREPLDRRRRVSGHSRLGSLPRRCAACTVLTRTVPSVAALLGLRARSSFGHLVRALGGLWCRPSAAANPPRCRRWAACSRRARARRQTASWQPSSIPASARSC